MLRLAFIALLACSFLACAGDRAGTTPEPADSSTPNADTCGPEAAALSFSVDDRANGTFASGDLIWTGSFQHDAATNILTYATSWLPEEGPYPHLFDDGPFSEGGHETEGQVAGDHIHSTTVCYDATQTRTLAYGLLNEDLAWIWEGPNGQVTIEAGSAGGITLEPFVMPGHGTRDLKVTLNLESLHSDFPVTLATHRVYLKGTLNSWTPVQLLDDGKYGDAIADDGILTYHHAEVLGPHDGLLQPGQAPQFVFVFTTGDAPPSDGIEYKVDGDATLEGTGASVRCIDGWIEAEIFLAPDSKGKVLNTTLVVCPDDPPDSMCAGGGACPSEAPCINGFCDPTGLVPCEPPCEGAEVCVEEACITPDECETDDDCGEGAICLAGACGTEQEPDCDDAHPCDDGYTCVQGECVLDLEAECSDTDPCPEPNQQCVAGSCVDLADSMEVVLVVPGYGFAAGGTEVTLYGQGFNETIVVHFGSSEAEVISVSSTEAIVVTPPHDAGVVDVSLESAEGATASFPGGFQYIAAGTAPSLVAISPSTGPSGGGIQVEVSGAALSPDGSLRFGAVTASSIEVADDGTSAWASTPPLPLGTWDVTWQNPDGQEATLTDAFSVTASVPAWAWLHPMPDTTAVAGAPIPLTGSVYEAGLTDASPTEPGFSLEAEVGFGDVGTSPMSADAGWTWASADYTHDEGNDDVFSGAITPPAGTWAATLRFTMNGGLAWLYADTSGSTDGFASGNMPTLTITEPGPIEILGVSPSSLWPGGGETMSVNSLGAHEGCTASIDSESVTIINTTAAGGFSIVSPPHPPGTASLLLTCPEGSSALTLTYSINLDGVLSEWPEGTSLVSVAPTAGPDSWANNWLGGLHADSDGERLYLGISGAAKGSLAGPNAVIAYIDTDAGASTGITDTSEIDDSDHPIDDVLGGALAFSADGFGAEVAFASLNMSSYIPGEDDSLLANAGWRVLSPPDDLPWLLEGHVHASPTGIEATLSLEDLLGPPQGTTWTIGVNVRIANSTGLFLAPDALPPGTSGDAYDVSTAASSVSVEW